MGFKSAVKLCIVLLLSIGTFHIMGLKLNTTVEMIRLFEPLVGQMVAFILILGITGAGLSTIFPIVLIAPWLISDFTGKPREIRSPFYRILILGGLLFFFGSIFLEKTPPILMVFSQAFQAAILPAVAIPVFVPLTSSGIVYRYRPSLRMNTGLIVVIIFSITTTYFAILSFF